ncbi:MAG: MFS transporter [Deltaproteobacteria bacterium]|nr:MFS transporter [Deltaproteobacteria bacterium]
MLQALQIRPRQLFTSFSMGFTCGTPYIIVVTLVQAWLKDGGVALGIIGLFALARLPYSLKLLWAPFLDYIKPFGERRRGWIFIGQLSLIAGLLCFSHADPRAYWLIALLTLWVSFSSATQDIVVDAYRREDLSDQELPTGTSAYMWGYRLGMVIASGGGLILADYWGWAQVFQIAALLIIIGPATILFSPEPRKGIIHPENFWESVRGPFLDFFKRDKALLLFSFVLIYRLGEQLIVSLNTVFFMEAGYTKTDIGVVVKGFGLIATLVGVALANMWVNRKGLGPSLWLFGWLQLLNIGALSALWYLPAKISYLAFFISLDHVIVGATGLVFAIFLASQTKLNYTATQYAILTSVMAIPANLLASPSGWIVEKLGWPGFYLLGAILVLPGLLLLRVLKRGLRYVPRN